MSVVQIKKVKARVKGSSTLPVLGTVWKRVEKIHSFVNVFFDQQKIILYQSSRLIKIKVNKVSGFGLL